MIFSIFFGKLRFKKFTKVKIPNSIVDDSQGLSVVAIWSPNFSRGPLNFRGDAFMAFQNWNEIF